MLTDDNTIDAIVSQVMELQDHRKMLIVTFVNAIYLYDDKIVLPFNYHDGSKTITFDDVTAALSDKKNDSD